MNHQLFEEWLLAEEPLNPEQEQLLKDHLQTCETCPSLLEAWRSVEKELSTESQAAPAPGFTHRWQEQEQGRQIKKQRGLVWLGAGMGSAAAIFIFLLVNGPQLANLTLSKIVVYVLYNATVTFSRVVQFQELTEVLFKGFVPLIAVIGTVLFATSLSCLCLIWVITMWRFIMPKGVKV